MRTLGAFTAALVTASPSHAGRPAILHTPTTVRAGQTVTIRGSAGACAVGDTVFLLSRAFARTHEFASVPAVLARVRPGGRFRTTATIPRSRKPGRYAVTGRCGGGDLGIEAQLLVMA